ncbi:glycosyltransferase family 4 protein [Candidatus Amesbacteria bacterium]|nr:glycosyltransferase family 4 protein [Candidatus Amesbacteria bacterium]
MKKIAILSKYSGIYNRGVESWAENLRRKLNVDINPTNILGYDIIIPTNGRAQVFIYRLITWIFGKKLVVFGHSGPGADDKWNLWCSPNVFVAFSSPQADWAKKFKLPWTKVIIIPHAVDTEVFFPSNIPKTHDVLCVAANSRDKRVDLVRKAAPNLLVVGSGQELEVEHSKMPVIYNQSRVFCFVPQPWEAFGLVFLEAMACNLPVVTIDDPVRRGIVGEAGVFVKNPENAKELANAIKLALITDWGDKPRKQAEKFSWIKIAKQYEDICNNNYQR